VGKNSPRRIRASRASSAEVVRSLAIPRTKAVRTGRAREYSQPLCVVDVSVKLVVRDERPGGRGGLGERDGWEGGVEHVYWAWHQTSNAHFLGEPWWRGESPSFLNYGRDARGTSVVPWGTTSLSHPYRHLISLITFRCLFSVLTFFPSYARGLYPVFSFPASCPPSRRLAFPPSQTSPSPFHPSPTLSHTPSTRAHYEFAKPKNDK
jgi:hypothetical protein